MAKKDDLVPVTADDVAQAWQDVENAKKAADELRVRFVNGDDSVTQDAISSQVGVVEWLELVARRTENQRERYEKAYAIEARKSIKAEMLAKAADDDSLLIGILNQLVNVASGLEDRGAEHDRAVLEWRTRLDALGVPNRGVTSPDHESLGMEYAGAILIDSTRIEKVHIPHVLSLIFDVRDDGIHLTKAEDRLAHAREIVSSVGKAIVS